MAKKKRVQEADEPMQTCIRCKTVAFIVWKRDVSRWQFLREYNASAHCEPCWRALAAEAAEVNMA